MVASCHRKSGNYQIAFETYKSIHEKYPENIECMFFDSQSKLIPLFQVFDSWSVSAQI
jgi:hypothetical protein